MKKNIIIFIVLIVTLLLAAAGPAPKIDQSQTYYNDAIAAFGYYGYQGAGQLEFAQTFQPNVKSRLDSVIFKLDNYGNPIDKVVVYIYTDGGVKPGTLLGMSNEQSISSTPGNYSFTFSKSVNLSANTTYWLVVSRTGALDENKFYHVWGYDTSSTDYYTRGTTYINSAKYGWFEFSYPPSEIADAYFIEYIH